MPVNLQRTALVESSWFCNLEMMLLVGMDPIDNLRNNTHVKEQLQDLGFHSKRKEVYPLRIVLLESLIGVNIPA